MFERYRKIAGLTQEQVAEQTNISWRQLQRIEKGISIPTIETFAKLVKVLKISNEDALHYIAQFTKIKEKEYANVR